MRYQLVFVLLKETPTIPNFAIKIVVFNDLDFYGPPTPARDYVVSLEGGPIMSNHVSKVWWLVVWRNETDEKLDVKTSFFGKKYVKHGQSVLLVLSEVLSEKGIQSEWLLFQFRKDFFQLIVSFNWTSIIATGALRAVTISKAKCAFIAGFCLDFGQIKGFKVASSTTRDA